MNKMLLVVMVGLGIGLSQITMAAGLFEQELVIPEHVLKAMAANNDISSEPRLPPSMVYNKNDYNWVVDQARAVAEFANIGSRNVDAPFIMLAGYYDTHITYAQGGTFKLIAYAWDPQGYSDLSAVEIYYLSEPTGVYLLDNGASGDFSAGDSVFGIMVDIPPNVLPADRYLLELVAIDLEGNRSDIWPYLTIHP